jgi:serine protease Do
VRDSAGNRHQARWIAADKYSGLTLLKTDPGVARPAQIAEHPPELGAWIVVVGNPFGLSHSVSYGNVSGLRRTLRIGDQTGRGLIQFTAPIHPGDSGGLVADAQGRMVGIVRTALVEPDEGIGGERRVPGIGFAIPASEARWIADRLRQGERIERGYLGITGEDASPVGIRVTAVADGSPADSAGLQVGDVILAVNEHRVQDFDALASQMEQLRPGSDVRLRLRRNANELELSLTLGERPERSGTILSGSPFPLPSPLRLPADARGRWGFQTWPRSWRDSLDPGQALLGVESQPVSEPLAKSLNLPASDGALITQVLPNSPASRAGLRTSELIVSINSQPVRSPHDLYQQIQKAGPGAQVRLGIVREGKTEEIELVLVNPDSPPSPRTERWSWAPDATLSTLDALSRRRDYLTLEALEARIRTLERRVEALEKQLQTKTEESLDAATPR